ncbi:unnamed protein product [Protopolystoma xenopodis]|uniref:Uncharacterized protein n=1 Tax=Protopolystoma xenopodis TaxID=117903 RepID=A0A3S5CLS0_9PLAT|nr:unnamed protein product [Protopolystoma xenopodis]
MGTCRFFIFLKFLLSTLPFYLSNPPSVQIMRNRSSSSDGSIFSLDSPSTWRADSFPNNATIPAPRHVTSETNGCVIANGDQLSVEAVPLVQNGSAVRHDAPNPCPKGGPTAMATVDAGYDNPSNGHEFVSAGGVRVTSASDQLTGSDGDSPCQPVSCPSGLRPDQPSDQPNGADGATVGLRSGLSRFSEAANVTGPPAGALMPCQNLALLAKDYVESLHQNTKSTLIFGKNNVLVQTVSRRLVEDGISPSQPSPIEGD